MFFCGPPIAPLLKVDNLKDFTSGFTGLKDISGGVSVYGSAAAYALVWELGSRRAKKPGPRTVWGVNRNGETIIMSSQAPIGYVDLPNREKFWPIIEAELNKVDFSQPSQRLNVEFSVALDNASQKIAKLIADTAPVDSGDLRSQISYTATEESDILGNTSRLISSGTLIV